MEGSGQSSLGSAVPGAQWRLRHCSGSLLRACRFLDGLWARVATNSLELSAIWGVSKCASFWRARPWLSRGAQRISGCWCPEAGCGRTQDAGSRVCPAEVSIPRLVFCRFHQVLGNTPHAVTHVGSELPCPTLGPHHLLSSELSLCLCCLRSSTSIQGPFSSVPICALV